MKRSKQRGSSMLESLFGMCFLLFLCFAMVELFLMIGRQMAVDYASFWGGKFLAQGYAAETCRKGIRVAAIPVSGRDLSSQFRVPLTESNSDVRYRLRLQADRYQVLGRASGVEYEYWYNEGKDTRLNFGFSPFGESVHCRVQLQEPPFLIDAMKKMLQLASSGSGNSVEPEGDCRMYNHAHNWLDE